MGSASVSDYYNMSYNWYHECHTVDNLTKANKNSVSVFFVSIISTAIWLGTSSWRPMETSNGVCLTQRYQTDHLKQSLIIDAQLIQDGFFQVSMVQNMWRQESSLKDGGIGIPTVSYCSPLTRCLVTNSITFAPLLAAKEGPRIKTVVVEVCLLWCRDSFTQFPCLTTL